MHHIFLGLGGWEVCHSTGRTSVFLSGINHSNLLKGCTVVVVFHLLECLCTNSYLIWFVSGQMPKAGVSWGDWKETWCRSEKNHWINCSNWYLLVWNWECLQFEAKMIVLSLAKLRTNFSKYCVWCCKGRKKGGVPRVAVS